jgi:hypothetical protein
MKKHIADPSKLAMKIVKVKIKIWPVVRVKPIIK